MSLLIPKNMQARIQQELSSLPVIHGKIILTLEFNCPMEKVVGSLKVIKSTHEEIRPC